MVATVAFAIVLVAFLRPIPDTATLPAPRPPTVGFSAEHV
jgi:hypothetical protein